MSNNFCNTLHKINFINIIINIFNFQLKNFFLNKIILKSFKSILILLITLIVITTKFKKINYNPKSSYPRECGFNNIKNKKKPTKIKMTAVILIFIIFDLEVSIITPMIITFKKNLKINLIIILVILTFITTRIIYETKIKSIK